jgi:branched-chain amino acid transport system substrate-binding protein
MKRVIWISLIALSVFVLGSALPAPAADNVLKIGVIGPVSGNYADHGALERMGMEMALKELGGKIGGRTVEFIVADSETNPDTAARRTRTMIEKDGVKFLMGGISSSECIAVGAVANERKVLYIATNGNADDITSTRANRNMFRIAPNMAMLGRANATYAFENLGKKW